MASIIQSIITKLGKNATADAVIKALEGKGAKLTPKVIDEVMASSLPQYEKDIFKSLTQTRPAAAQQSSKPGAIIPGASAAPTGGKTIANTKTTPKVTSDAGDLMFGSKRLVEDMRKVNKPEAEIEKAVRDAYPDLPEASLDSVMGRSSTQAPDTAQELAVRTPVPTKTEPAYDGAARLKELQAADEAKLKSLKDKVKRGEYGVWGQPDKVPEAKPAPAKPAAANSRPPAESSSRPPAESSSRPPAESKQADMLDSIDNEPLPNIDDPVDFSNMPAEEVAALNSKGLPDLFAPDAAPAADDLSKGLDGDMQDQGAEVFDVNAKLEAPKEEVDLYTPPDAEIDELRGAKASGFAENLPPVPEDVRKPATEKSSAIIPGKQDPWEVKGEETYTVKPPEMQQLDLSTPSGSRPDPANSQVTANLDLGVQNKGMSKAVPGVLGLGALALSGDSRQTPADTQTSGTQIAGGVQPTATPIPGEPGDGAPIKSGEIPQGTPVAEFSSADPSIDPRKSSTRASVGGKAPVDAAKASVDAKAVQTAATALETAQNQAGEIDKRVPGWGDALKQALGAQVSTYEKLAAELKQDMAAASDEYQAAQYRGMMGEALTAFAQALVKYGAASEGVKRKLDVAEHYKPTPADFTRVFQAIDNDFKQKTAAIQEALKGAKEGIQSANERLMKVDDRESEQAFKSQENEQAYLRDLKGKILANDMRMKELEVKAGYDKEAAAELAKRRQDDINLRGQWGVAANAARGAAEGGAKGQELAAIAKYLNPAVNSQATLTETAQNDLRPWREAYQSALTSKTPNERNKKLVSIAQGLGVPIPTKPGMIWGTNEDYEALNKVVGEALRVGVPNVGAAGELAGKAIGRAIESFSPAMQQKIVQQPNGAKVMINGQTYTKQDGMLVPAN